MTMTSITISRVCERDIDLLLLEELTASRPFVEWFLREIGIAGSIDLIAVAHSVTGPNGESDVELTVQVDGRTLKILVENKVDADLQPRQSERYRDRAASYISNGACSAAATVIVAPAAYFTDETENYGFDHRLTHEALRSWFERSPELGPRGAYKRALLEGAISRGRAGWQPVPDEVATAFWESYWRLAESVAPELRMPRPGEKPAGSSFIRFMPAGLPPVVQLLHKVRYGNVDLQFAGMGDRVLELEQEYGHQLRSGMRIEQAAKSAVVRVRVPLIDMSAPFSDSESAVREGIRAATELLAWYRTVTK